jgi:hypothetical protein
MESTTFINFIKDISPLSVIALLVIAIIYLVKNGGLISKLRGTQVDDKKLTDNVDLMVLNSKLDQIMTNHLHELPRVMEVVDRIEQKQSEQSERLARVETKLEFITNK